ncbi:ImmA/IrrE family metallo-endopeptidase [Campylobacter lari]|uniref:ImmA/IrrE family metallo-endopeptidase n=1 Tax=Campylobacter lari TaxID=201 RepID=UPI001286B841|nr:ImmA/IrrE family metallo-endopeptidase [Campylobacter lari]MBT0741934.1 ImmA/IrrE family metallo-endopeptidase [Campylobacter lari]MCR6539427.1 ImmA/IrrE family metallo-endopeptidase [Campylobacter lari]
MDKEYTKIQIENIAKLILEKYADNIIPVDVLKIAHKLELKVGIAEFSESDISGMIIAKEKQIYIADNDIYTRQRFSIAHEIGHYLLHYVLSNNLDEKHISFRDNVSSMGYDVKEIEANHFAASLLMPEKQIREEWAKTPYFDYMADKFKVSMLALSFRLNYLGIVYG